MSEEQSSSNGVVFFTVAVKAGVLVLFLSASTWVIVRYGGHLWKVVTDPEDLQGWVESYGPWGPLVFLGVQVLQIIVFVIPGEVVQAAGGYLFGPWAGVASATTLTISEAYLSCPSFSSVRKLIPAKFASLPKTRSNSMGWPIDS